MRQIQIALRKMEQSNPSTGRYAHLSLGEKIMARARSFSEKRRDVRTIHQKSNIGRWSYGPAENGARVYFGSYILPMDSGDLELSLSLEDKQQPLNIPGSAIPRRLSLAAIEYGDNLDLVYTTAFGGFTPSGAQMDKDEAIILGREVRKILDRNGIGEYHITKLEPNWPTPSEEPLRLIHKPSGRHVSEGWTTDPYYLNLGISNPKEEKIVITFQ